MDISPDDDQDVMELGETAHKTAPREEWKFDQRLMTPDRLLELAKNRGVRVQRDERGVVVVCADCEGQVMPLAPAPVRGRRRAADMSPREKHRAQQDAEVWGPTFTIDLGQLLADTVRHGVNFHDDVLSGLGADCV